MREQMVITFEDVKSNTLVVKNWFAKYDEFEPVFKLYFDTLYNPDLYTQNAFLNYVTCLETYHRIKNTDFEGIDHSALARYDKMLKQLPFNHQKAIQAALSRKSDKSLNSRIASILRTNAKIARLLVKRPSAFARQVSLTRNFFLHHDKRIKNSKSFKGGQLHLLVGQLRVLLECILLLELGYNTEQVEKMIRRPLQNLDYLNGKQNAVRRRMTSTLQQSSLSI